MKKIILVAVVVCGAVIGALLFASLRRGNQPVFSEGPYRVAAQAGEEDAFWRVIGLGGGAVDEAEYLVVITGPNHSYDLTDSRQIRINQHTFSNAQFSREKINLIRENGKVVQVALTRTEFARRIADYKFEAGLDVTGMDE